MREPAPVTVTRAPTRTALSGCWRALPVATCVPRKPPPKRDRWVGRPNEAASGIGYLSGPHWRASTTPAPSQLFETAPVIAQGYHIRPYRFRRHKRTGGETESIAAIRKRDAPLGAPARRNSFKCDFTPQVPPLLPDQFDVNMSFDVATHNQQTTASPNLEPKLKLNLPNWRCRRCLTC